MIDADRLNRWALGAVAGSSLELGRGARLDPLLGAAVRSLCDGGVLAHVRKRTPDGQFLFQVQRSAAPMRSDAPARSKTRAGSAAAAILRALRSDIARGRPCRTNAALADDLDIAGGRMAVAYHIRVLVARGALVFDHFGPLEHRVVTDRETGRATPRAPLRAVAVRSRRAPRRALVGAL